MWGQIIFVLCLAVVIQHIIRYCLMMDYHKDFVYRHAPGDCKQLLKDGGSEDLTILDDGVVLISTGLGEESPGSIKMLDMNDPAHKVTTVPIKNAPSVADFMLRAHGLSAWTDPKTGEVTLFVITHRRAGDFVEVFQFDRKTKTLTYMKSITDPIFSIMNDLVAVGKNQFYITKMFYVSNFDYMIWEMRTLLHLGGIVFYNGSTMSLVASGLFVPNGINASPDKKFIYLAENAERRVVTYKREADNSLTQVQSTFINSGPDNIEVDQTTGDLWIGSHPLQHKIMLDPKPPAQVFQLKTKNGLIEDIVEVYANNGDELTGPGAASVYKDKLVIGSVKWQLILCDVKCPS